MAEDITTLVGLFHHQDQARAAVRALVAAGIPRPAISTIDRSGAGLDGQAALSIEELGVPERDHRHLADGVRAGGVIVAVAAITENVAKAEAIFERNSKKIDEAVARPEPAAAPMATAAVDGAVIPVVEEELAVGKRTVDRGGVRLYRNIVETPVEESINLREERVTVDRQPVDRAVTQQDLTMQGDRTIELTETAEQAVVGKRALVVEEVRLGKEMSERTEHIHDTVRRTEVEVEEVAAGSQRAATTTAPTTTATAGSDDRGMTRGGL